MRKCFSHLLAFNLLHLTETLVGNVFAKESGGGSDNPDDHGFGKSYKWKTVAGGFSEAKETRKPIMAVFHKPGCPACANLRPKFANSLKLVDLSQHFVMVNIDNSAPTELPKKFTPDGTYVPRILFFAPDGEFLGEIVNQDPNREPGYKYHYWSTGQIADSMLRVLKLYPKPMNVGYFIDN